MTTIIGPYLAIWHWLRHAPPDGDGFSYHHRSMLSALLVVVVFSLPVELLLVEILLPWLWLRVAVAAMAVVISLWVVGLVLGTRTLPHVVGPASLVVRFGTLVEGTIPYALIEAVEAVAEPSTNARGIARRLGGWRRHDCDRRTNRR